MPQVAGRRSLHTLCTSFPHIPKCRKPHLPVMSMGQGRVVWWNKVRSGPWCDMKSATKASSRPGGWAVDAGSSWQRSVFHHHTSPTRGSVLPPPPKKDTQAPHTPVAVRAATCTRADRREVPSGIQRDRWETPLIQRHQRESNHLLHGKRRVRCHSSSGLLRYHRYHPKEQRYSTHTHAPAPPCLPSSCMVVR